MKISSVNNLLYTKNISSNSCAKKNLSKQQTQEKNEISVSEIPAYALKSNYCPSFGRFRKTGEIVLIDKSTEKPVMASLYKEKTGDYISYKIYTGREEAGFMDMNCEALFPEGDYVLTEPDNSLPRVFHLRSVLGNKYSGIGTALINAAIEESYKAGKNGCLWLNSEKGYARGYSPYRSNENPIPFYYKLGFRAVNPAVDELIQICIENSNYKSIPDSALLLLTPEAAKAKNEYFAQNYDI